MNWFRRRARILAPAAGLDFQGPIKITAEPERLQFERIYRARLDSRASIQVKLWSGLFGDRLDSSFLEQPDGKWVIFDLRAPADHIIDRTLLPKVEKACEAIIRLDGEFIAAGPKNFKDAKGQIWVRA